MFNQVNPKQSFPELEKNILNFWNENKIFQKSIANRSSKDEYVFFDGPPFATGMPHYGHILAGTIKDVVPRFWTMKGKRITRRFGWDCHGLPVENLIEKELGIEGKDDIEDKIGVVAFNEACSSSVLKYAEDWKDIIARTGRWVDFNTPYKTMDRDYMESVWWVFKELWNKNLVYEGYKAMHICPRCVTTLSNFEVGQGYKDVTDISVTAKFKIKGEENTYMLAWTTTPWTLPGNMFLAVSSKIDYVIVEAEDLLPKNKYIIAKSLVGNVFGEKEVKVTDIDIKKYIEKEYEPLFPYFKEKHTFKIVEADFVSDADGTGVVHIAPAFGEDDLQVGQMQKVAPIQHVYMDGKFIDEVVDFIGHSVKPKEDVMKTDRRIADYLEEKGLLFEKKNYKHSYPHCWRCDTPLLNYVTSSWFVEVTKIKDRLIKNNNQINWVPNYIKYGRFGKWLENARDWSVSRNRYWGTPLPIWRCEESEEVVCIGSVDEIEKLSGEKVDDIHKHFVDDISFSKKLNITAVRHGQFDGNVEDVVYGDISQGGDLNERGKKQAHEVAKKLKEKNITIIFASDFDRTKQTADIISKESGVKVIYDPRLREQDFGDFNGKTGEELNKFVLENGNLENIEFSNGESWDDVKIRLKSLLKDVLKKYEKENILFVSHYNTISVLGSMMGDFDESISTKVVCENYTDNPYVDNCQVKEYVWERKFERVTEVFDCWFESGSMPYAQKHYPFHEIPKLSNKYIIARHGYGEHNEKGIIASNPKKHLTSISLTDKGVKQVEVVVQDSDLEIDYIFSSDFLRTKQTAEIWKEKYEKEIVLDGRLREIWCGSYDGKKEIEFRIEVPYYNRLKKGAYDGESYEEIVERMKSFISEMEEKYEGKNILIVSHGGPLKILAGYLKGQLLEEYAGDECQGTGSFQVITKDDQVNFEDVFPAEFIAEGQDQTRGWFYTLMVLSTALFDKPAFKNVIVNGIVLAEDGKKMSKRLKNYPDPTKVMDAYGADSMRLYLLGSPVVRSEDLRFVEKGVEQVVKSILLPLWNSYSFFVTYGNIDNFSPKKDFDYSSLSHSLDVWVVARLHETIKIVDESMQKYMLQEATLPLVEFIDDLTNWYIRRSRRRFWKSENDGDKMQAYETLWYVLTEFVKIFAPFAPFTAEEIFKNLTEKKSVHLENFPDYDVKLIEKSDTSKIAEIQNIVSLGHKIRAQEKIKVRQPLSSIEIYTSLDLNSEDNDIIREELNVKEILFVSDPDTLATRIVKPNGRVLGPRFGSRVQEIIKAAKSGDFTLNDDGTVEVLGEKLFSEEIEIYFEGKGEKHVAADGSLIVSLDTILTPELVLEGEARDFIRIVQDMRKEADFHVADRIIISVFGEYKKFIEEFTEYVKNETLAVEIKESFNDVEFEKEISGGKVGLKRSGN